MKKKNNTTIYQIYKMSLFNISLFSLALALSCSSGDSQANEAPSDFVVEVATVGANDANPNGDGSGKVVITATATNAARYAFRIDTGDMVENKTGILEHGFTKNGTHSYNIAAWAYSQTGEFVTKTVNVEVYRSD